MSSLWAMERTCQAVMDVRQVFTGIMIGPRSSLTESCIRSGSAWGWSELSFFCSLPVILQIGGEVVPVGIYAAGLLAALGLSAAYNLWPVSGAKWLLRRFDHAAIYVLIAATYTPFLAALKTGAAGIGLLIVVWVTALIGACTKLLLPGRFDRLSIAFYLLLGWR